MKQQSSRLGKEKITVLMLKLSVPAFIGMFVMALYNVIDTIYIARGVGTLGVTNNRCQYENPSQRTCAACNYVLISRENIHQNLQEFGCHFQLQMA